MSRDYTIPMQHQQRGFYAEVQISHKRHNYTSGGSLYLHQSVGLGSPSHAPCCPQQTGTAAAAEMSNLAAPGNSVREAEKKKFWALYFTT